MGHFEEFLDRIFLPAHNRDMKENRIKSKIASLSGIFFGSFVLAVGINQFLVPARMTTGGMGGIATIFYYLFGTPLSVTVLVGNLFLFAIGFREVKLGGVLKSAVGILSLSFFLFLTQPIPPFTQDLFAAAVFGGILEGVGVGLTVLRGGSTGGSDFAALMIHRRFPHLSMGSILLVTDTAVILLSGLIFRDPTVIWYSLVSLYLSSRVMDLVLVRGDFAKAVVIVSEKSNIIAEDIMTTLGRGVTGIYTRGYFLKKDGLSLLCIAKGRQTPGILSLVKKHDPAAFSVVLDVRQARGEGFGKIE